MARVLFVVPGKQFQDEELFQTSQELQSAGHRWVIASVKRGICTGSLGGQAVATETLTSVAPHRYDAVVFVGGAGARSLTEDPDALQIARAFYNARKPTAAIGLAPMILANAGVLEGREVAVAGSEQEMIEDLGAHFQAVGVVTDGNIVTASDPTEARGFGQELCQALALAQARRRPSMGLSGFPSP
jgi:protease I